MPEYQVVVGNVGTVYNGDDREEAERVFHTYREASVSQEVASRASGEPVTLFCDGEIEREHNPREYVVLLTKARLRVAEAKLELALAQFRLTKLPTSLPQAWTTTDIEVAKVDVLDAKAQLRLATEAAEENDL